MFLFHPAQTHLEVTSRDRRSAFSSFVASSIYPSPLYGLIHLMIGVRRVRQLLQGLANDAQRLLKLGLSDD